MNKQLVKMRLADIIPYENNPRHNDNAVEAVKESIRQCEYIAPIIVDEDNVILAGHTRAKALAELGKTEADVMVVSGLSDEQKRKYRLLDNKTNELATWDIDKLEIELEDIDFDGFDFGFDVAEDFMEIEDRTGNMAQKFLVPPFSILQGNKGEWLKRKRRWIDFGIRSELGRGATCLQFKEQSSGKLRTQSGGGTERSKAYKNNEKLNSYITGRKSRRNKTNGQAIT